jgi:hypothetical protein
MECEGVNWIDMDWGNIQGLGLKYIVMNIWFD